MGTQRYVVLTAEERDQLDRLTRIGNSPARTLTRARILLLSDRSQGERNTDGYVAKAVQGSISTVGNVRQRYLDEGLHAALYDKPRPGATPKFTGEVEAHLTMLACSQPPEGHGRWTLRLLADQMIELGYVEYISHVTVRDLLKKTNSSRGR
jgi:transposase